MKKRPSKLIWMMALAAAGLVLVGAAFFARQLHLDNNDHWGSGRYILLLLGVGLWLGLAWLWTAPLRMDIQQKIKAGRDFFNQTPLVKEFKTKLDRFQENWAGMPIVNALKRYTEKASKLPGIRYLAVSKERQAVFWAVAGLALTLWVYAWLASAGTFVRLTPSSNFVDMQAQAFLKGQLYLTEAPPAELLALQNPYDLNQRTYIKYLWDASLYQGRYYLYWGPLPALLETAYRGLTHNGLGDEAYGFLFYILFALVITLWLLELRKIFSPGAHPLWMFLLVPLLALSSPLAFNLSWLSIYVVSAISAQAFILWGLYLIRRGVYNDEISNWRWMTAGLLFGMGLSARINLLLGVGWIGVLLAARFFLVPRNKRSKILKQLLLIGIPLAGVMAIIMSYNAARFNSPFEFGSRYQLTVTNINDFYASVVSAAYIPANLFVYLFQPVGVRAEFPFIFSKWLTANAWPSFIRLPRGYLFTDPVDGLLLTMPFILLALLPFIHGAKSLWAGLSGRKWEIIKDGLLSEKMLLFILAGNGLIAFIFILMFYYPTMRYLIDAVPSLMLVAVVGSWQWNENRKYSGLKTFLIIILGLASVVCGFLLCINGSHDYLEQANPALYFKLIGFFAGK